MVDTRDTLIVGDIVARPPELERTGFKLSICSFPFPVAKSRDLIQPLLFSLVKTKMDISSTVVKNRVCPPDSGDRAV